MPTPKLTPEALAQGMEDARERRRRRLLAIEQGGTFAPQGLMQQRLQEALQRRRTRMSGSIPSNLPQL